MSIDDELDKIVDEKTASDDQHKVTKYRRRDLRNSLASRIGIEDRVITNTPPKKRLRFTNVPLDVSDFLLEDMVKEFAEPIYSNFYDHKDSRTAIFQFENPSIMQDIAEKYNGTTLNGNKIAVEVFEQEKRFDKRRFRNQRNSQRGGRRGTRGSHYKRIAPPASEEMLNLELDEYMNK